MIRNNTELVIEGFPRSGNTFALVAFESAQVNDVVIAHHLHSPAQIRIATKQGVPCMVLIRNPLDAVVSLSIRHPDISLKRSLQYYISFYSDILSCHEDYVVVTFEEVITDFGKAIEMINDKFDTDFKVFDHSLENIELCMSLIEQKDRVNQNKKNITETSVARPSQERNQIKSELRAHLIDDVTCASLLKNAENVYRQFIALVI